MQGQTPTGFFKQAEMRRQLKTIQAWRSKYLSADDAPPEALIQAFFGRGHDSGAASVAMPPVLLNLKPNKQIEKQIELSGRSGILSKDMLHGIVCQPKNEKSFKYTYLLQPFLDCVCLSLLGMIADGFFTVHVLFTDGIKKVIFRIPNPEEGRKFLMTAAQDMLMISHAYTLPLDAIMNWKLQKKSSSLEDMITRVLENARQSNSCSFGPVRAEDYAPPKDAEMLAERRLGLFFECMFGGGREKKP